MNANKKGSGYAYSRQWFDFTFETPNMITPIHTALYFWIVELNNRLQWKEVIGLPTAYSMEAIGLRSYRSYKKVLDDLIKWGFIHLVSKSWNQHTCNQVALVLKAKADRFASDLKAKAEPKQRQKQSSDSKTIKTVKTVKTLESRLSLFKNEVFSAENLKKYGEQMLNDFFDYWIEKNHNKTKMGWEMQKTWDLSRRLQTWLKNEKRFGMQTQKVNYNSSDYD